MDWTWLRTGLRHVSWLRHEAFKVGRRAFLFHAPGDRLHVVMVWDGHIPANTLCAPRMALALCRGDDAVRGPPLAEGPFFLRAPSRS